MIYNNIWADNADIMSLRYTGTGALKTDFTRTGKRSMKGAMADGMKSATRLMHKNFRDHQRQESIGLRGKEFLF